jgi:hypothetical protein
MTRSPKVVQTRPRAIDKPFFDEGVVEEPAEVLLCVGKGKYEVDDEAVEIEDVESPVSSAVYLCTYVKNKYTKKRARATHIKASTMAMSSPAPTDITNVCSVFSNPTNDQTTCD